MDQIYYLIKNGGGGFTYWDVYNMPVPYRRYNVRKLVEDIKRYNEEIENAANNTGGENSTNITMQDMINKNTALQKLKPDFTTKVAEK